MTHTERIVARLRYRIGGAADLDEEPTGEYYHYFWERGTCAGSRFPDRTAPGYIRNR
jgi:hypothetical protein